MTYPGCDKEVGGGDGTFGLGREIDWWRSTWLLRGGGGGNMAVFQLVSFYQQTHFNANN